MEVRLGVLLLNVRRPRRDRMIYHRALEGVTLWTEKHLLRTRLIQVRTTLIKTSGLEHHFPPYKTSLCTMIYASPDLGCEFAQYRFELSYFEVFVYQNRF